MAFGSQDTSGRDGDPSGTGEGTELDTSTEDIRGLSCQICYQAFSREGEQVPRNLQCGHSYCTQCLSRLVGQHGIGSVRCPTCKHETLINGFMDDVHQLPKNFGVLEILANDEERRNPPLPRRPAPKPPGSQSAGIVGNSASRERGYSTTSNEAASNYGALGVYERRCTVHENEPMKVFCKSCNEIICIYCQVYGSHTNHCCELLTKTAEQGRREVISMSENLGRSKENLLLARQIILETISAVRHKEEKTIREVTYHFEAMRKKVYKRECQIKDVVKCKTSQKIGLLENQERTVSDLIDRCELTQRVCTRALTEDDLAVVEEKDVLLNEMTGLTDLASDCELAPVCVDNITCYLSRDALDVIMVHGSVEERSDMTSTSQDLNDSGHGDRVTIPVSDQRTFNDSFQGAVGGLPLDDMPQASSSRGQRRSRNASKTCERHAHSSPHMQTSTGTQLLSVAHNQVNTIAPAVMQRMSSEELEVLRSSLDRALSAAQNQHDTTVSSLYMCPPTSQSGTARSISLSTAREAAAQAAIKRHAAAQQVFSDYLSSLAGSLNVSNQHGPAEETEMQENLSNIHSAMQDIQSAVTSARATLENSMTGSGQNLLDNPQQGQSQTQTNDSRIYEQIASGGIYEQVSDTESQSENTGNSTHFDGIFNPAGTAGSENSTNDRESFPTTSPIYHVYDSSKDNHCSAPVNELNSDSSDEDQLVLPDPDGMYEDPCDCGYCDDSASCSCSDCNSDGEIPTHDSPHPHMFANIPSHLDLPATELQMQRNYNSQIYAQKHKHRMTQPANGAADRMGRSEDVSRVTRLFNSLMKKPNGKKKHHHAQSQPGASLTRMARNKQPHAGESRNTDQTTSSFTPFFNQMEANLFTPVLNPNAGAKSKTTQHKRAAKKSPRNGNSLSTSKKSPSMFLREGSSYDSLSMLMTTSTSSHFSGSHQGLSMLQQSPNSAHRCGNSYSSCDAALFLCSYCHKEYCHNCALSAAGKKCPAKPSKAHAIVPLDEDLAEDPNAINASLNIPKNPEKAKKKKFLIKCRQCGEIKELCGDNKTCSACGLNMQIDLALYNPCPFCNLLNSKDNIACEYCQSSIIST